MAKEKPIIKDVKVFIDAKGLLMSHSVSGGFGDNADLSLAKFHSVESIKFAIDLLKNNSDTDAERIKHLKKVAREMKKFKGQYKEGSRV
jgi:hypothetical protein